jgi:hypothetical protein
MSNGCVRNSRESSIRTRQSWVAAEDTVVRKRADNDRKAQSSHTGWIAEVSDIDAPWSSFSHRQSLALQRITDLESTKELSSGDEFDRESERISECWAPSDG